MTRKWSLAKGMFSTKFSLAKGYRSKTGAAHPCHFRIEAILKQLCNEPAPNYKETNIVHKSHILNLLPEHNRIQIM